MRFLSVFIVGVVAIILVITVVNSKILPFWGDAILVLFLLALLGTLVQTQR